MVLPIPSHVCDLPDAPLAVPDYLAHCSCGQVWQVTLTSHGWQRRRIGSLRATWWRLQHGRRPA